MDESFLQQISEMPTKNLVQAKEFTKKLEEGINKYRNRALTTVQVI